MDYTKKEKAILNRDRKKFSKAEILFKSFMKKYNRNKKLKKLHFTKNKNGRYIGETIFVDMIIAYPYTKEEKELLYTCLINMPPKVLSDFEQLYIKSSSRKFVNYTEEIKKRIENLYENKAIHESAYNLYNEKIIVEDKLDYKIEKYTKREKKYGKYTDIYKKLDEVFEQRNENARGFKKQLILSLIDEYYKAEDYPNLSRKEFEKFKITLYDRIKSAYINYKKRLP
jgi:hypothetical protein